MSDKTEKPSATAGQVDPLVGQESEVSIDGRIEKAVEAEQARWQKAIYDLLVKTTGDDGIDGSGCESGDPLDVTLTEISMGLNSMAERQ